MEVHIQVHGFWSDNDKSKLFGNYQWKHENTPIISTQILYLKMFWREKYLKWKIWPAFFKPFTNCCFTVKSNFIIMSCNTSHKFHMHDMQSLVISLVILLTMILIYKLINILIQIHKLIHRMFCLKAALTES